MRLANYYEVLEREGSMERLIPKFRFGHIDPAAVEARRARRGPGYEFYQIVPTNIMLVTAVLGIKDFTREAVEAAIPNYWNCVGGRKGRCVCPRRDSCIRAVGTIPRSEATQRGGGQNRHTWRRASGSRHCGDATPGIEEDSGGRTVDR